MKYFKNFTMFFFRLYTHPFNICRPTCLVCLFKSFHTIDIEKNLPNEGLCRLYYV